MLLHITLCVKTEIGNLTSLELLLHLEMFTWVFPAIWTVMHRIWWTAIKYFIVCCLEHRIKCCSNEGRSLWTERWGFTNFLHSPIHSCPHRS